MMETLRKYKFTIVCIVMLSTANVVCAILFSSKGDVTLPFILSVGVTAIGAIVSYLACDKPYMEKKK
jgi:hypothetical protein